MKKTIFTLVSSIVLMANAFAEGTIYKVNDLVKSNRDGKVVHGRITRVRTRGSDKSPVYTIQLINEKGQDLFDVDVDSDEKVYDRPERDASCFVSESTSDEELEKVSLDYSLDDLVETTQRAARNSENEKLLELKLVANLSAYLPYFTSQGLGLGLIGSYFQCEDANVKPLAYESALALMHDLNQRSKRAAAKGIDFRNVRINELERLDEKFRKLDDNLLAKLEDYAFYNIKQTKAELERRRNGMRVGRFNRDQILNYEDLDLASLEELVASFRQLEVEGLATRENFDSRVIEALMHARAHMKIMQDDIRQAILDGADEHTIEKMKNGVSAWDHKIYEALDYARERADQRRSLAISASESARNKGHAAGLE